MVADKTQVRDGIYMTVEQYLVLDEATDAKYEYENGYVFMVRPPSSAYDDQAATNMAGGSVAHADICAQLTYLLVGALRGKPCRAYTSASTTTPTSLWPAGHKAGPWCRIPLWCLKCSQEPPRSATVAPSLRRIRGCRACRNMCSWAANTSPSRFTGARATSGASITIDQATWSNSPVSASVSPLTRCITE
jgi:hypothetical protein